MSNDTVKVIAAKKCPECETELYFSKWFVDEKVYKLNSDGTPKKKAFKTYKMHPYDVECGLVCPTDDCWYTDIPSGRAF